MLTLALTCVASFAAQINAWVLRYTVDSISELVAAHKSLHDGLPLLSVISGILIGTEIINVLIGFGQKYFGEKLRILLSRDLARDIIERILPIGWPFTVWTKISPANSRPESIAVWKVWQDWYRTSLLTFCPCCQRGRGADHDVSGKFPCRTHCFLHRARLLSGESHSGRAHGRSRRLIKRLRENKSQGILGILESMPVIKSFLREDIEEQKQLRLQDALTDTQMRIRKTSFFFDGMKNFIEQIGVWPSSCLPPILY